MAAPVAASVATANRQCLGGDSALVLEVMRLLGDNGLFGSLENRRLRVAWRTRAGLGSCRSGVSAASASLDGVARGRSGGRADWAWARVTDLCDEAERLNRCSANKPTSHPRRHEPINREPSNFRSLHELESRLGNYLEGSINTFAPVWRAP